MKQEIDRLSRLVKDLLLLTRLDSHEKVERSFCPVDIGAVLANAAESMQMLAGSEGIRLVLTTETQGVWITGDAEQLYRVVVNLVDNAIRYSPPHAQIEIALAVETQTDPQWAIITIRDYGQGIAPDQLAHIFNRFLPR